ncbi:gas vesicle protein GvpK [Portibacter marinus]|uniref:gas vesicle protein GvpK n=1 Tax=Portibacter marinus TaxID=2898660 RepID=UPI001F434DD4|nr:gas vesicle protein GvpK [Portibacter marinus]
MKKIIPGHNKEELSDAVGQLLVIIAETIRLTLEKQSLKRFKAGTLSKEEEIVLSQSLYSIAQKMKDLKELFGMERDQEAGLKLGNIDGTDLHLHEAINSLIDTGLVVRGDASLGLGNVSLAELNLMLHLKGEG